MLGAGHQLQAQQAPGHPPALPLDSPGWLSWLLSSFLPAAAKMATVHSSLYILGSYLECSRKKVTGVCLNPD